MSKPTHKIHIPREAFRRYGINQLLFRELRSHYKQPSLKAIEEKILSAYATLLREYIRTEYPSSTITCAFHECEDALLLISALEPDIRAGQRTSASLVGTTSPNDALTYLQMVRQELLDQRLIQQADKGETSWFKPEHWERLKSIRPDLAPAPTGEDQ